MNVLGMWLEHAWCQREWNPPRMGKTLRDRPGLDRARRGTDGPSEICAVVGSYLS